jgi:hypothetical protein
MLSPISEAADFFFSLQNLSLGPALPALGAVLMQVLSHLPEFVNRS